MMGREVKEAEETGRWERGQVVWEREMGETWDLEKAGRGGAGAGKRKGEWEREIKRRGSLGQRGVEVGRRGRNGENAETRKEVRVRR